MENVDNDSARTSDRYINTVIGDYVIQEHLGGGEYSYTFKGINKKTREIVAIKVFPKSFTMTKSLYEAEIKAYKSLKGQPGILQLNDEGENNDDYFIITEYIPEGSLREILKKHPKGMDIQEVINLLAPVADAVDLMHNKHIIHRDLKPENILVRNTNEGYKIFVADFGVVKFTTTSQQFQTDNTAGTYWYIAPKSWNANSKSPQTRAVDIYAFGVMTYEALEGRFPYEDISEVFNNKQPLYPINTIQKSGKFVAEILLKAIHNDPEQRQTSAKDVINGIRQANSGSLNEKQIAEQRWIGRKVRNYKIEEVLGAGRMGTTLRANDVLANKQVVLKAFTRSVERNEQAYDKEIKSLFKLENGYGVLIPSDIFEHEDISFIVTEYQSGGTLRELLNRRPKLTTNEIMDFFTQIAKAIDYIHEKKIVHRDIKPENIVYSIHEGKTAIFITDFGVSAILVSTKSSFSTHHIGTPRYMAPELFDEKTRGTKAVDIYAFGIMLYEALEGHAPFEGNTRKRHSSPSAPMAEKTLRELGSHAKNVLLQTLVKDAEERPKTAIEIMQQIRGQHEMFLGKTYGKYTIENFVGRGTFGATYRAHDSKKKQRKKYAFKVLSIPEPLMHEIELLKKFSHHDGILSILEGDSKDGIHYIVTDYLNGINLRDMLQSNRQVMSLDEALRIFKPIAKAIDYLHDFGMAHGDIKPENVILCKSKNNEGSFEPVITGFGISKIAGKVQPFLSSNNYNYIAPELWKEGEPTKASDIYAFGIMLYETLEGTPPFNSKTLADSMAQHLHQKPPAPQNLIQFRGQYAANFLLQSLDKNPQRRPNSAFSLISQIEDKTQDSTSTMLGRIKGQLRRSLRPIINMINKKVELPISWLVGLTTSIIIVAVLSSLIPWQSPGIVTEPSQVGIVQASQPPSENSGLDTSTQNEAGRTPEPPVIDTTVLMALPLECEPQYLPDYPSGEKEKWPKEPKADGRTSLEAIYTNYYGQQQGYLDWYALAYYNNRKALEGNQESKYRFIDPVALTVENGQIVFIPHQTWIDEYRKFPRPVLEEISSNTKNSIINISGSSTLYPLSMQIKTCFEKMHPIYQIQIEASNTKTGLIDFCQGRVELFASSEQITPEMINTSGCPADINFIKFEVAKYATVIFISDKNPYINELAETPLNKDELVKLLFTAQSWDDVRNDWDKQPIIRYYPPVEGGAFEVVKNKLTLNLEMNPEITNLNRIEEGDSVSEQVVKDPFSIGFSRFSDYQKSILDLRAISIDNILPSLASIESDNPTYPLTRSLYLYTDITTFDKNPLLQYFINYYLSYELDFIDDLGYFYPNVNNFLNAKYYPKPSR